MEDSKVKTVLLEFHLNSGEEANFEAELLEKLREKTAEHLSVIHKTSSNSSTIWCSENGDTTLILKYCQIKNALVATINLEYTGLIFKSNAELQAFFDEIRLHLERKSPCLNFIPVIARARENSFCPYFTTSDDRLVEYGFKEIVFDKESPYQRIQIVKSVDFGNVLILDGAVNLAENDTVPYTHALMNLPQETDKYDGKEVLILGGGDGGLLKELLELPRPPKMITMVELDDLVMVAAAEHLRNVCGSYLDKDNRRGSNYEVITGDAFKYMAEMKLHGKKFDYIFGDLTDVPVEVDLEQVTNGKSTKNGAHSVFSPNQEAWGFISKILSSALDILKQETGSYMTHCNGKSVPAVLEKFEDLLKQSSPDGSGYRVDFERRESFVPSFMEVWIFYQAKLSIKE